MTKSYKYQRVTAAHTLQLAEIAEREGAGGWRLVYVFHNGSSGLHQFEALLELESVPSPPLDPQGWPTSATIKTDGATAENMPTARELQEVCAKCNTTTVYAYPGY